jgi:hypothetical protein
MKLIADKKILHKRKTANKNYDGNCINKENGNYVATSLAILE